MGASILAPQATLNARLFHTIVDELPVAIPTAILEPIVVQRCDLDDRQVIDGFT
jgi:hypothetical protein